MNPVTFAMVSFLMVAGVTFLAGYLLLQRWPAVDPQRLKAQGPAPRASILRWEQEIASRWQRIAARLGRALGPGDPARRSQYRRQLVHAGYHDPRAVVSFMGAKAGVALLSLIAYPLYGLLTVRVLPHTLLISVVLGGVGFFLPDLWLRNRVRHRQEAIVHALPDVLDLLMVCVEGGLAFDAAVARIADRPEDRRRPLHTELLRMQLEIRAGRPREEALRDLGERTGVEELKRIVSAFIQADRLGTPLGKTLRIHAEASRVERRHRAEERAYLAPLKMIFPTAVFLLPAFMLIAMAPAVMNIIKVIGALGGARR